MEYFPGQSQAVPAPSADVFPSGDATILMACLDWARDKLERLVRYSGDAYTVSNLRSITAAMDPERNPKLKGIYRRHLKRRADG